MMPLVLEAAARAAGLTFAAWLGLTLARIRSPHEQKSAWTAVLLLALAMPWVMHTVAAPLIQTPACLLMLSPGRHAPPVLRDAVHLGALYALIAAALLCRHLASCARGWWVCRTARVIDAGWTQGLDVRVSAHVRAPATFARTILLPEGFMAWSEHKRTAVIAHEGSHVRERDGYLLWLAQLYTCLFWLNPMAWWLRRRVAALAEATADEAALLALDDRPGYAQILLEFAGYIPSTGSTLSMSQQSNVSGRIERILAGTGPSRKPALSRRLVAFGAVLPAALAIAALQLAPTQAVHAETPAAGGGTSAQEPRIVSSGDLARLQDYYPAQAKRRGIDGLVRLAVRLDDAGRATDTLILHEEPAGQGFGAAASALAHTLVYSNPTGHPVEFTFEVRFSLAASHS